MRASEPHGKRVLLLLQNQNETDETGLVAGLACWTGEILEVKPDNGGQPIQVRETDVERAAFPPKLLPQVIANKPVAHVVDELAQDVTCVIPLFVPTLPRGAEILLCLFAGLARGAKGEVILMATPPGPDPHAV